MNEEVTKIALAVVEFRDFEINENINRMEKLIKDAKKEECEYIFFGEAVLSGFSGLCWNPNIDLEKNSIDRNGEYINTLKNIIKKECIGLGFGYFEKHERKIYGSYLILDKDGKELLNYRRISPGWREENVDKDIYKEGEEFLTFDIGNKNVGLAVCGDLWYDEHLESLNNLNFEFLLWPLYIDYTMSEWQQKEKEEYCKRVKFLSKDTAIINSISNQADVTNGGAFVISKKGEILAELPMNQEGILTFLI